MSIGSYALYGGLDGAALIQIGGLGVEIHEMEEIVGIESGVMALKLVIACLDVVEELLQELFQFIFLMGKQGKRGWVGYPGGKVGLVYIETYATDGIGDEVAFGAVGDEYATDFVLPYIDVVWPLDMNLGFGNQGMETVAETQREHFCEHELIGKREKPGMEYKAEGEIFPRLGFPLVVVLTFAQSLGACTNNSELLYLGKIKEFTILVGRC